MVRTTKGEIMRINIKLLLSIFIGLGMIAFAADRVVVCESAYAEY